MTTMGRTVLTDELQEALCDGVADGRFVQHVLAIEGVSDQSLYNWLKRADAYEAGEEVTGEPSGERCLDFARAFRRAKALGQEVHLKAAQTARVEKLDSTLDRWILSKLDPKAFGDLTKHEVAGRDGGPVKVEVAKVVLFPAEDDSGSADPVATQRGAAD